MWARKSRQASGRDAAHHHGAGGGKILPVPAAGLPHRAHLRRGPGAGVRVRGGQRSGDFHIVILSPSMMKTGFPGNQVQVSMTMGKGNPTGISGGSAGRVGGGTSGARRNGDCRVRTAAGLGGGRTQGRTKSGAMAETLRTRSRMQGRITAYATR